MTGPIPRRSPTTGPAGVVGGLVSLTMLFLSSLAIATGNHVAALVVLWIVLVQSVLWLLMKVVRAK